MADIQVEAQSSVREDIVRADIEGYPTDIAVNPETNTIYVLTSFSSYDISSEGEISVINGTTNAIEGKIPLVDGPDSIAVNPETNTLYVTGNSDSETVSVIDGQTNKVKTTIGVAGWLLRLKSTPKQTPSMWLTPILILFL